MLGRFLRRGGVVFLLRGAGDDVAAFQPAPKVDIGAELMYGVREIENGKKGDISRVQFTTKYSF